MSRNICANRIVEEGGKRRLPPLPEAANSTERELIKSRREAETEGEYEGKNRSRSEKLFSLWPGPTSIRWLSRQVAKIYIDSNILLDVYRSEDFQVEIADELLRIANFIVVPQQTIDEFRRNRAKEVRKMKADFRKAFQMGPISGAVKNLAGWKDIEKKRTEISQLVTKLNSQMDAFEEAGSDAYAQKLEALFASTNVSFIPITDQLIELGRRRKNLGNPPTSDKRTTIGDEVIWESLLGALNDDLIIASRDHTFLENEHFLKAEYKARTGKILLAIVKKVSEGFELLGQQPPPAIVQQENMLYPRSVAECPDCGSLGDTDKIFNDEGEELLLVHCPKCGILEVFSFEGERVILEPI